MQPITLTDDQIDARAKAYAREHGVNYAEALNHVVSFAETSASGFVAPARTPPELVTDAQRHAAALRYANEHRVSYFDALQEMARQATEVGALQPGASNSYSESDAARWETTDRRIDAAAHAYAKSHGVSYSEALSSVASSFATTNFSEASPAGLQAAQALERQQIEIFRAGQHIDDAGVAHHFSESDLAGMAASYNPALREAPLTVGHPKNNLPAYGWVRAVGRSAAGALTITPHQVDPQFAEMVQAGRFKKRSASFYPPQAPNNPTPGKWYLRHVAFLGAQQPAVNGLADVNFKAAGDGAVCFCWE